MNTKPTGAPDARYRNQYIGRRRSGAIGIIGDQEAGSDGARTDHKAVGSRPMTWMWFLMHVRFYLALIQFNGGLRIADNGQLSG